MNKNKTHSFYLVKTKLNEAYLGKEKKIKQILSYQGPFNDLDIRPNTISVSLNFAKPKKSNEISGITASIDKDDYIISHRIAITYSDNNFNLCAAVLVSSEVELIDSKDLTLSEVAKYIKDKKVPFLQPIVLKAVKITSDLLENVDPLVTVPNPYSILKTIDNKMNIEIPTK